MSRTKEELLIASNEIRRENRQGLNTAERVGGVLYDITEHLGEGGGDTVTVIRDLNQGVQIAKIKVNNTTTQLYAPEGGGGGGNAGYQKVYFANVASGTVPSAPQPSNYDANADAFTTSTPQWNRTNTNPQEGQDTYAIWVYFNANGNIVTIDGPVCLTGAGTNGEDGEEIEWIYICKQDELSIAETSSIQQQLQTYCKTGDNSKAGKVVNNSWTHNKSGGGTYSWSDQDVYPESWTDNAQGITESLKYEYAAFRRSKNGTDGKRTWGDDYFHGPMLWSAFGKQGLDGDGVEYIFFANATGVFPDAATYNPQNWTNDSSFQDPEYIRTGTSWMDDPIDLDQSGLGQGAVEWVSMRKKQTVTKGGVEVHEWQSYSAPAVWSRIAKDGGAPKEVDYTVFYFKAMATHTTPSQGADTAPSEWYEGEDSNWGTAKPYLYCQEKTVYKDHDFSWGSIYYKGQWVDGGGQGPRGEDGYTLVVDPTYAIFEETSERRDANDQAIIDSNKQDFDHYTVIPMDLTSWVGYIQLLQGSTPQTIGFRDSTGQADGDGIMGGDNCIFKVTVTDGTGGSRKGLKVEVQSITAQVTTAKIRFWTTLNNTLYCLIEIPIYINRLGTRFQYIVGDSETTVMKKTLYDANGNAVTTFTYLGEYLRSSTENISTLKKKVDSGKNILAPLTKDWCSVPDGGSTISPGRKDTIFYGDHFSIEDKSGNNDMYSYPVTLEPNTDYCFSAYFDFDPRNDLSGYVVVPSSYSDGWRAFNSNPTQISPASSYSGWIVSDGRYGFTFRTGNSVQMFFINLYHSGSNKLYRPQLELGTTPTQFEASSYELSSEIKQTADNIKLAVYDELKNQTGIDVTNGTVDIIANNTTFSYYENGVKKTAKVSIDATDGTLHAVGGTFSGKITAKEFCCEAKDLEPQDSIDLINDPYYLYIVTRAVGDPNIVSLPSAATYPFVELRFFCPRYTRSNTGCGLSAPGNEKIYYSGSDGLLVGSQTINMPFNQYIVLKSIGGMWYVISGTVSS